MYIIYIYTPCVYKYIYTPCIYIYTIYTLYIYIVHIHVVVDTLGVPILANATEAAELTSRTATRKA